MTDSGLMWPPPSSFQTRQINNILTTPGTTPGVSFLVALGRFTSAFSKRVLENANQENATILKQTFGPLLLLCHLAGLEGCLEAGWIVSFPWW